MNRKAPVLLILAYFAVLPAPEAGQEPSLSGLLENLEAAHENIRDLEADFSQTTNYAGFDTPIVSKGRLYFKKPGLLRWEYTEPNRNQVVINGGKVWIYTPELAQVIVRPFTEATYSQIPLRLLAEAHHLDRDFDIEESLGETGGPPGLRWMLLRPKQTDGNLKTIDIGIDSKKHLIMRMKITESTGGTSEIIFEGFRLNKGIGDKTFVFKPPAGTEVIEMPP